MDLSIIIPVYNEIRTIHQLLERVVVVPLDREIIIVDDGSQDGTVDYLKSPAPVQLGISKIYFHKRNQGKGAAIRTGLPHAEGDYIVIQDGDLEYDPTDFVTMLALARQDHPVVYGSRNLKNNENSYLSFYLGGLLVTYVTNLLFSSKITDEPTCYKMFRRDLIQSLELNCNGFEFCPEVTAKVLHRGIKIIECPINYYPRKIAEGKKTSWKDGVMAIYTLLKYRLKPVGRL
ncbi:MAG: glycosyltransferase family 2 protein [Candidatus Neomarinimicrobiota bacterium]